MAVPKRKTSKGKKGARRSHDALGKPTIVVCPHCQEYTLPHQICSKCGWYKDKIVKAPKVKKPKIENAPA